MTGLLDNYHRQIDYMRISVTDRCNLCCVYCSEKDIPHLMHDDILRYEEIEKIIRAAARLGVRSLRLTGGEPLIKAGISELIKMLADIEGIEDISLTTNGTLLAGCVQELKQAGLRRVNISLDTFKPEKFKQISGVDMLKDVFDGIEAAKEAGLTPVKINTVVMRGINDDELLDFARKTMEEGWHIRYIEKMPLVANNSGTDDMIAVGEMMDAIQQNFGELEPCLSKSGNGPAKYYRLTGAEGTIGFIAPVTDCFCDTCNRFRLTADGGLRPCLLENDEIDIKRPLRAGASIEELEELMKQAALLKRERHRIGHGFVSGGRRMWQIGG